MGTWGQGQCREEDKAGHGEEGDEEGRARVKRKVGEGEPRGCWAVQVVVNYHDKALIRNTCAATE